MSFKDICEKIEQLRFTRDQAKGAEARRLDAVIAALVRQWKNKGGKLHIVGVSS